MKGLTLGIMDQAEKQLETYKLGLWFAKNYLPRTNESIGNILRNLTKAQMKQRNYIRIKSEFEYIL